MLQPATLKFLKQLALHNNKPWFDANRNIYETARADFAALVEEMLLLQARQDKVYGNFSAKDCMFRINRDVRFSKDKTPYKQNFSAYFCTGGKKSPLAGYYFHLEPGKSFIAAGMWYPEAPLLKKLRQEIDYNYDEFRKIIFNKKFKETFGELERTAETVLQREPKGYEKDNPAIEFLKLKSWVIKRTVKDEELYEPDLAKKITNVFKIAAPFVNFLNMAVNEDEN